MLVVNLVQLSAMQLAWLWDDVLVRSSVMKLVVHLDGWSDMLLVLYLEELSVSPWEIVSVSRLVELKGDLMASRLGLKLDELSEGEMVFVTVYNYIRVSLEHWSLA
jgi:hypothetical protein